MTPSRKILGAAASFALLSLSLAGRGSAATLRHQSCVAQRLEHDLLGAPGPLEAKVAVTLTHGKIIARTRIGTKIPRHELITFEDGTRAIWIPEQLDSPGAHQEIAAYVVDRRLGMNRAPLVVKRKLDGANGTIHLFVQDGKREALLDELISNKDRNAWFTSTLNKRSKDYKKQQVLTMLLQQDLARAKARSMPAEMLERLKQKLKNQQTIQRNIFAQSIREIRSMTINPRTYSALLEVSDSEWKELLGAHLSQQEIFEFLSRKYAIIDAVETAKITFGTDHVLSTPLTIRGWENEAANSDSIK